MLGLPDKSKQLLYEPHARAEAPGSEIMFMIPYDPDLLVTRRGGTELYRYVG